ncbi:hypothetical protein [Rhizobium leguminosarum]|uniref:hypothetical protein n=1 Tax=Rhizobium leguminosarum TaxID=384 RepID=UPI0024B3581B|nr:hypothetical protein [Rhizobium leguminosarum]WHO82565.1 hypothetical protein QMO81_005434 [Rhizobium leguminosarum]
MIKKRRMSFERAHGLLEEIRNLRAAMEAGATPTPAMLRPLWLIQRLLVKEITRAERKIRRIKSILRMTAEDDGSDRSISLMTQVEAYRHLTYLWRSFGDAVAFLFMDKFALRQAFYNTHNTNAKQDAGFLSGKAGIVGEWDEVEKWLRRGMPALLADLTNTIRHGDVCLMVGPDPVLIEVKLGELDTRGRQQRDSIRQLMEFFENDEIPSLRGLGKIRRTAHQSPELGYADVMEDTIIMASRTGAAFKSPEPGLWYVVITDGAIDVNATLHGLGLGHPIAYSLNEVKIARSWAPYSPLILSIRDRESSYRFMWGDVIVFVIYDLDELVAAAALRGLKTTLFSREEDSVFELIEPTTGRNIRLAWQMFDRLAFEFTSPGWLLATTVERLDSQGVPSAETKY